MESVLDEGSEDLDGLDVLDTGVGNEDRVELGVLDGGKGRSLVLDVSDDRFLLEAGHNVRQGRRVLRTPIEADDEDRGPVVDLANVSCLSKLTKWEKNKTTYLGQTTHRQNDLNGGILGVDIADVADPTVTDLGIRSRSLIVADCGAVGAVADGRGSDGTAVGRGAVEGVGGVVDPDVECLDVVLESQLLVALELLVTSGVQVVQQAAVRATAPVQIPGSEELVELNGGNVAAELSTENDDSTPLGVLNELGVDVGVLAALDAGVGDDDGLGVAGNGVDSGGMVLDVRDVRVALKGDAKVGQDGIVEVFMLEAEDDDVGLVVNVLMNRTTRHVSIQYNMT